MSASSELEFKGYAVHDTSKWTEFKVIDFQPKTADEYDVDIAIEYCGICGSDVHTITGGWGEIPLPLVVGHEAAGTVKKVGSKVSEFKVGDRVVVGAQVSSCMECNPCKTDNENYCPKQVDTYGAKYPDGVVAMGGYSTAIRAPEKFVFKVPDAIELDDAAPMACGGLTVFGPMYRWGVKSGHKVAIAGLGGLGHFAVMFAAAMGAEVTVLSHQANKKDDALKMGASHFVCTADDKWAEPLALKFDYILSTIDIASKMPLEDIIGTLNINGNLHICAMPDDEFKFKSQALAGNGASISVNHIGSKKEANAMLKLAAEKGIKTWKQVIPMKDVGKGVQGVKDNSVRYRYVLKQDINA
ncbi:hypothetical protein JCM3766R1_005376 [Sporobolomyces carnicolor]